jgi:DNA-binding NarL/FixJ family response regulator
MQIRVLVVDDHDLFRTGLASLLSAETDIEVVGQASGGQMGVRLAAELQPDVVLMDLRMKDLSGIEATRQIVERRPETRVLALTVASAEAEVTAVLRAGACGFLAKETETDYLVMAIRAASGGVAWLSPKAAEVVLGQIRTAAAAEPPDTNRIDQLSAREREVLSLIATGKGNSEIANELNISPRTAKNHVSSILTKLHVPTRVQAAVYAVRREVS